MAMNRQTKRMLQKQGQLGADGEPVAQKRKQAPPTKNRDARVGPAQFVREVRGELRKVAWPTRQEVVHYSLVVLVFLVVVTTIVAVVDWAFARAVLWLFGVE